MIKTIGKLLHVANSYPDAVDKEAFYRMKTIILKRLGTRDGFDIQHFEGKICWSCHGTGVYMGSHTYSGDTWHDICDHCVNGWYKRPVWVVLDRYRLGGFVFHQPAERLYEEPPESPSQSRLINGYIKHRDYGFEKPRRACLMLAAIFDWRMLRDAFELRPFGQVDDTNIPF